MNKHRAVSTALCPALERYLRVVLFTLLDIDLVIIIKKLRGWDCNGR